MRGEAARRWRRPARRAAEAREIGGQGGGDLDVLLRCVGDEFGEADIGEHAGDHA